MTKGDPKSVNASEEVKLLPGENIVFEPPQAENRSTDEELNIRYAKGDIRIVTETARYSLAGILSMLRETVQTDSKPRSELRYKLDPEYQRRHRWGPVRKSRLIESFLMNVPVPPIFLYERDLARYEVMDGRQRLTALSEFYQDIFELEGLQYWTELNGRKYSQLPSKVRDGIDRRYISSIILLKETASNDAQATQLKKMVFERLNSGGVALSSQETRNAVYDGPLNQLCLRLSKNQYFQSMWHIPNEPQPKPEPEKDEDSDEQDKTSVTEAGRRMFEKMEDVELILRFFAYRQLQSFPGGFNGVTAFLDRFLIEGNKFGDDLLSKYQGLFENTISFLFEILGKKAFYRMTSNSKLNNRPTKILYDPLMYVASQYSQGPSRDELIAGKKLLIQELKNMFSKNSALFGGRRTNPVDIRARNKCLADVFQLTLRELTK